MYSLEFVIKGLPSTSNTHRHWRIAGGDRKKWKEAVVAICSTRSKPRVPLKKACLFCVRFSSSEPDYDNLVISFKAAIDGLKVAGIIEDDKSSVIVERKYSWIKAAPKDGAIMIRVEER